MLEKISKYVHEQMWMPWTKILINEEKISEDRVKRWKNDCFMPYEDLSESMKDLDRIFAKGIIKTFDSSIKDRYLDTNESVKRLVSDYKKYNNLFIAFDFDNTVYDFHKVGDTFPKLEKLLRFLKDKNFNLILFTGNEGDKLKDIISYCKERGYEPTYINENPIMKTTKPYYNILLDDRAGLNEAYQILIITLNILNYEHN